MPWSNQNGGGDDGRGPWGGGGGKRPPDIEELLRRSQDRVKQFIPGGGGGGKLLVLLLILAVAGWAVFGGFYRVQPDEQGVELVFGEWVNTTGPGLHYNYPSPVGEVYRPKVTQVNKIDIGYRTVSDGRSRQGTQRDVPEESLILTGDQNIVDIDFTVLWRIKDAGKYLFNIRNPDATVKVAAESAMREVVGQTSFDDAVTIGRESIESRTKILLQAILDDYGAGIDIVDIQLQQSDPPRDVIDSFNDVQRAKQDRERLQNEAQAYANSIVPEARGEAEKLVQEANAYREKLIKEADGEGQRFLSVYESYRLAPEVTRRRMYLEAMGDVFADADKVIIDTGAGGTGVVPYLPLPELRKRAGSPVGNQ